jgi:hypothetical protein
MYVNRITYLTNHLNCNNLRSIPYTANNYITGSLVHPIKARWAQSLGLGQTVFIVPDKER